MMFWQKEIMEAIGSKIGKFIALEEGWEQKVDRRSARILIEVDLRDGLYEEIHLELHGSKWWQRLDYWKIPFICFSCRQVRHLAKECKNSEQKAIQHKNKDKGIARDMKSNDSQPSDRTQEPIMTEGRLQANPVKTAIFPKQIFLFFSETRGGSEHPFEGTMPRRIETPTDSKTSDRELELAGKITRARTTTPIVNPTLEIREQSPSETIVAQFEKEAVTPVSTSMLSS